MASGPALNGRNAWLDTCRAFAIVLVLLSHGRFFLRDQFPAAEGLRFGGFLGVELFFVLSGYLIGGILLTSFKNEASRPWRDGFYARRWLRTLPNYYLFLVVNLLLAWQGIRAADVSGAWLYAIFAQNLAWPTASFFTESWSLAVEELFYLGFPLLIIALRKIFKGSPDKAMATAAIAVAMGSLVARLVAAEGSSWDEDIRKVVLFRLDALMYGVLLVWLYRHGSTLTSKPVWRWGASLIFVFCALYAIKRCPAELDASWFAKTVYLSMAPIGCAGIILTGLHWRLPAMVSKVGGFMARISFSAYLANIPVAMLILHFSKAHAASPQAAVMTWTVFMLLTLLVSWLCYRWVEQPVLRYRDLRYPVCS